MLIRVKAIVLTLLFLLAAILWFWSLDLRPQSFNDYRLQSTLVKGNNFPKTLVDASGQEFILHMAPQRLVSVTLATDEILSELVGEQRVVGITHLADDPKISNIPHQYSKHIKRINSDIEAILALQPDLVFVTRYTRAETVRLLFAAGIAVVRLSGDSSFKEIKDNIVTIGRVTGTEDRAGKLLQKLQADREAITAKIKGQPSVRVLFYSLNGYTAGVGTTVDEVIGVAGGINVAQEAALTGSQKISEELAIGLQADVILLNDFATQGKITPAEQLMQNPNWQHVPAVANKRVYGLQGRWPISDSQYSWQGIKEVATLLHTNVFE
jgi:iron complex transport system substrate-binding protein